MSTIKNPKTRIIILTLAVVLCQPVTNVHAQELTTTETETETETEELSTTAAVEDLEIEQTNSNIESNATAGVAEILDTDIKLPDPDVKKEFTIIEPSNPKPVTVSYTEEDVLLLAKLMINEAGNDITEDKIAVAEVVKNRLDSDLSCFPNTIKEVIYQEDQFSDSDKIKTREPSDEVLSMARAVLEGRLLVLNNTDALFYRNPMITSEISPQEKIDWGDYKYYAPVGKHAFYTYHV